MTHKATIRNGYRVRPLLLALLFMGYGLWAVDDGFFDYPADNRKHAALQQFKDEVGSVSANRDAWLEYAAEHGLPESPTEVPDKHGPSDMYLQYGLMIVCLPIGSLALWYFIRSYWLWIGSDEQGLAANGAKRVPWEAITDIDRSRWQTKGIAVVHYDKGGQPGRLTLDDWKYETEPIRRIVQQVETHLGLEPVDPTGGVAPPPSFGSDQGGGEGSAEPAASGEAASGPNRDAEADPARAEDPAASRS